MDELLETISTAETMHDTFRVWITTEPHDQFSITLLQVTLSKSFIQLWIHNLMYTFVFWYNLCDSTCTSLEQMRVISLPLVFYQVYQWSTAGSACWLETDICRNFTEPIGSQQPAHVEAIALQCCLSPYCCAGNFYLKGHWWRGVNETRHHYFNTAVKGVLNVLTLVPLCSKSQKWRKNNDYI